MIGLDTAATGALQGVLGGEPGVVSGVGWQGEWVFAHLWAFPLVGNVGTTHFGTATSLYVFSPPKAGRIRMLGLAENVVPDWRMWVDTVVSLRVPLLVGVIVVGFVLSGLKWVLRTRALRGRTVAKVLLPSPRFNPSAEEVRRVAAVLSRTHRATRGLASRDAYAVRLLLRPDRNSGLVQLELHGHERARSVLNLVSFDQTESKPIDDAGDDDSSVDVSSSVLIPDPVPDSAFGFDADPRFDREDDQ